MPLYLKRGAVYDLDSSQVQKKQRLDFIGDVLTAAGQPEAAGYVEGLSDVLNSGDQVVPQAFSRGPPRLSSGARRSSRRGRVSRRMPRTKRWRSKRRRRRTFNQKGGSALLKFIEPRRNLDPLTEATYTSGDGTTRVLYINNPLNNIAQGTSGNDVTGDSLWIKSIWVRGRISLDQTTNSLRVRILVIRTRQYADLPAGFTIYGNTTTDLTNPTQNATEMASNIRIFETNDAEEAGQPSAPFVGNASGIDIIESNLVKVVGGREYFLSQQHLLNFQNVDIYVPINKKWTRYSEFGDADTDGNKQRLNFNYYVIMQVFSNSNANNILAAQDILGTFDIITYFKDI